MLDLKAAKLNHRNAIVCVLVCVCVYECRKVQKMQTRYCQIYDITGIHDRISNVNNNKHHHAISTNLCFLFLASYA